MKAFDLYFVGYYKHDGVQSLLAGPFVNPGDAEKKRHELVRVADPRFAHNYVLCKTVMPFEIEETL